MQDKKIWPIKILLNGRACSGKDTVAERLHVRWGFNCQFFAQGIYEIARAYFGMEEKDRVLLQSIGQKMREIDPDIWVKATYKKAEEHFATNVPVVITDCRQANEYLAGRELGYVPIRITAPLEQRIRRALIRDKGVNVRNDILDMMVNDIISGTVLPSDPHYIDISKWENESENGADNFDYIEVVNDGTLDELHERIDNIVEGLFMGRLWNSGSFSGIM